MKIPVFFRYCTFSTSNTLNLYTPEYITMWDVKGVELRNDCRFYNFDPELKAIGIRTVNAGFFIHDSDFVNLLYGIHLMPASMGSDKQVLIGHPTTVSNRFTNNDYAIYSEGTHDLDIYNNIFIAQSTSVLPYKFADTFLVDSFGSQIFVETL